jgi:hydrogenase maturation protease
VELCEIGTTGLGLLDHLRGQRLLIVVDACRAGVQPGEVRELEPDLDAPPPPSSSVHQIGPLETLFIAKRLSPELLPSRILLVLVETEGLSEAEEVDACGRAVAAVEREIRRAIPAPS